MITPEEMNRKVVMDFLGNIFGHDKLNLLWHNAAQAGHQFKDQNEFEIWVYNFCINGIREFFKEYGVEI